MLDMTESIAPRSDQMNAEDLLAGPRTFTIKEVRKGTGEQPFDFHFVEFPRPFRPSKTVRRLLVLAWGSDASTYVGKRLTLYRNPKVRFGGQEVGGIRISHMSDLSKPLQVALTETRGKRETHVVQPLTEPAPPARSNGITDEQMKELGDLLKSAGLSDREQILAYVSSVIDRTVASSKDLAKSEARDVITDLKQVIASLEGPAGEQVALQPVEPEPLFDEDDQ